MLVPPFNLRAEKDALYQAIRSFRVRWERQRPADVVFEFCEAIDRADAVCAALEQCPLDPQSDLALVKINVQILLAAARQQVARVQEETLEEIDHRIAQAARHPAASPLLYFPTGTIPSCPQCLEESGPRMAEEGQKTSVSSSTWLPAGTIVSCPHCEDNLYQVAARASIDDLVLDDGVMLQPLDPTIPKREAWRALACPHCGGRYYKDGKLHTVQGGWQ